MYTGGGAVGKIVATAAAKHLTPTSLELGGKSPVIIDPGCDYEVAARRILWGKMVNAGQTCIAPDYILVPAEAQDDFVAALERAYEKFYPAAEGGAAASESFGRIISPRHFERIKGLLDESKGKIVLGGETNAGTKYIAPTVVRDCLEGDSLLKECAILPRTVFHYH